MRYYVPFLAKRAIAFCLTVLLALLLSGCHPGTNVSPDPDGSHIGSRVTIMNQNGSFIPLPDDTPDKQQNNIAKSVNSLGDAVGHVKVATNMTWVLNTGYLVLFMQAGFTLLTIGLVRKENAAHLAMLNFTAYIVAFAAYFICGFAFQYGGCAFNHADPPGLGGTPTLNSYFGMGPQSILLGLKGFFMMNAAYDVRVNALMMFEVVFMETAAYIVVGAICERITLGAFILCQVFIGGLLYPVFGCWVWGGGWLSQLGVSATLGHGYVDFAGSTVVHMTGGFCAMAVAIILGPRKGRYNDKGEPRAFPAHNIPMVVTGTLILLFGWMGFNPGSTLQSTDLRISVIAVNTNLSAVFAALTVLIFWQVKFGRPDLSMMCNGMLAGLVAITAPCAFVNPLCASIIGILAGLTVSWGVLFNDKLKIDDPCGAISVHGYCGWLGGICVGLFADGSYGTDYNNHLDHGVRGLFFGDRTQIIAQLIGTTVSLVWAFGMTYILFRIVNSFKRIRVSELLENTGLDLHQAGVLAYPQDYMISGMDDTQAQPPINADP